MINVILYGELDKRFPGSPFQVEADTLPQICSYFEANYGGFKSFVMDKEWAVFREKNGVEKAVDPEQVDWILNCDEVHIMPALQGRKKSQGIFKAIIGVLMIGASLFFAGGIAGLGAAAFGNGLGITWGSVAMMGVSLVLSAFATPPKDDRDKKNKSSSMYRGPLNTQDQGGPVPVIYGKNVRAGIVIVHSSLYPEQLPKDFSDEEKDDPVVITVGG